ncbi:WhiB family transcriptional regulator [Nocardia sp. NPDC051981]|uniref:WhiB family transcriptional regulator n=1 Tax=Nocardia sp. NPDC051981 TaxID=3155417 RepID=UPI003439E14C
MSCAPDTLVRLAEWAANAVCARPPYAGSDLWYADQGEAANRLLAINLCRACPVIDACREATAKEEAGKGLKHRFGVRAGMTPRQRWLAEQASSQESWPVCGTTKAYYRHLQFGEPVDDACQAAGDAYEKQLAQG